MPAEHGWESSSKCTIGPVIGRVTTNTARVLVEIPVQVSNLTVTLNTGGLGGTVAKQVSRSDVPADRPTLFAFDGLTESTQYTVRVLADGKPMPNCNPTAPASFKTMSRSGQCRVGVVSCNKIYVTLKKEQENAWGLLKDRVLSGDLDALLHVGDQVYADHEYSNLTDDGKPAKASVQEFLERLKKEGGECVFLNAMVHVESLGGCDKWAQGEETVKDMFRKLYRKTWSYPDTAAVLANVPNTMISDDHEFRDDWGDREEDYDRTSASWFVARCAYRIYREYQAALNSGTGDNFAESTHQFFAEHFIFPDFLPHQGVALLTLDTRCKAFTQECYPYAPTSSNKLYPDINGKDDSPLLGKAQWDFVTDALRDGGPLSSATTLLVATGCPPMFLGEKGTRFVTNYMGGDDLLGSWNSTRNLPELVRLLDFLREWKARKPGRQLVLVGGDVHSGMITDVLHHKAFLCQQLTASPVSNTTLTPLQAAGQKFLQDMSDDDFPQGYTVKHTQHEWRCNYGTITLPDGGGAPALHLFGAGSRPAVTSACCSLM